MILTRKLTISESEQVQKQIAAWLDANTEEGESRSFIAIAAVVATKKILDEYEVPVTAGSLEAVDMASFKVRQAFNNEGFQSEVETKAQAMLAP